MGVLIHAVGKLVSVVLEWLGQWRGAKKQERVQESADAISADPAGEFARRFGVLPEERTNAQAAETETGEHEH